MRPVSGLGRMRRPKHGGESGFTLIELLGVTAILGIVSAVAVVSMGAFFGSGNSAACAADAKVLHRYVGRYGLPPDIILTVRREGDHLSVQENMSRSRS